MNTQPRFRASPTEATLLVKLARAPQGITIPTRALRSVATCANAGWIGTDLTTNRLWITAAGWRALPPGRQEEVRRDALEEYALRQGPADQHEVRRLIAAYEQTALRAKLLRDDTRPAAREAGDMLRAEAELLLARLCVLTRKPISYTNPAIVLDAAGSLRRLLMDISLAEGEPAAVDPRYRYEAQGIELPFPWADPWKASRAEVAAALLES